MLKAKDSRKNRQSNFFYSFLFLPKEKREAILTLYDFCRRTDDIVDSNEPMVTRHEKLLDWKEKLLRSFRDGFSSSEFRALGAVVRKFGIPSNLLFDLIEGVEMDLVKNRYETFEELYPYCYRVGSTVGLMSIEIFGYRNPAAKQYAENLGVALQLTNILRDLKTDAECNRIYLPLGDLRRYGYSESDLLSFRVNRPFKDLIRFECQRARSYFETANRHLDQNDLHTLYPAEAMSRIYQKILARIEQQPTLIFEGKVRIPAMIRMWIALRCWIRYRLGSLHDF